ncbi:MAG: DNA double-strand break repair nuclease NurA [Pyrobaculum sp.]
MSQDLDYWLEPDLLVALRYDVEKYVEKMAKMERVLHELKSLRGSVDVNKIGPPKIYNAYAVDSSYASPPLELVGGVFTIVAYGYVGLVDGVQDKFVTGSIYFSDSREADVSRYAAVLEKRLAARLLEAKARGDKKFDLLILDGEVAIHPLPFNLAVRGGKYEEVNKVVEKMLKAAENTGTTVVAIAKRVRSRFLSAVAGRCLPVNDKITASAMLNPGEWFTLGRLRELLPKWAFYHYAECEAGPLKEEVERCIRGGPSPRHDKAERLCRRLAEFGQNFGRVLNSPEYPHLRLLGDVEVVYYVPHGHRTAVRAEVLDLGGIGVDNVIAYLSATSSTVTGYPSLLDAVDQYIRVPPELVESVLTAIVSKTPQSTSLLAWPTNLQKRLQGRY